MKSEVIKVTKRFEYERIKFQITSQGQFTIIVDACPITGCTGMDEQTELAARRICELINQDESWEKLLWPADDSSNIKCIESLHKQEPPTGPPPRFIKEGSDQPIEKPQPRQTQ